MNDWWINDITQNVFAAKRFIFVACFISTYFLSSTILSVFLSFVVRSKVESKYFNKWSETILWFYFVSIGFALCLARTNALEQQILN